MISIVAGLQPVFANLPQLAFGIDSVPTLIKNWLDLLKFLKGSPPKEAQKVEKGNAIQVTNNSGDITVVNGNIYNTFNLNEIGSRAAQLKIPTKYGATALELIKDQKPLAVYTSDDLQLFRSVRNSVALETEIDAILEVKSVILEGSGTWKFKYGSATLAARISDQDFLARINDGQERFGHRDRFHVKLKTTQIPEGFKTKTTHEVTQVIGRV